MFAQPRWRDLFFMLFDNEPKPSPIREQLRQVRSELDAVRELLRVSELERVRLTEVIARRERVLSEPAGLLTKHERSGR